VAGSLEEKEKKKKINNPSEVDLGSEDPKNLLELGAIYTE
jgi:hypothetical protein